jgi:ferredoxin/bacterioferritin-associated ferredoxin
LGIKFDQNKGGESIVRTVFRLAVVDELKCTGCNVCVKICPVEAIRLEKPGRKRLAVIDDQRCLDCTLCVLRCPEDAIRMVKRKAPRSVGVDVKAVSEDALSEICHGAHMYPDQVICYCHRVQAKEAAAAILLGARTPEDISRMTGARTGCGTLCIGTIVRLLRAAGVELTRAPGYQWYASGITIWDLSPELRKKYKYYYLEEDLQSINQLFPGGKPSRE